MKPIVVPVTTVGGGTAAAGAASASAAASRGLRGVGTSAGVASKGLRTASSDLNVARGALIGLARVTPVAVFGLGILGTAAVAAGLAIKTSISNAAALEQQLNLFQAITGATGSEMAEVSETAKQLGADLTLPATSANDAATALTELGKAGLSVRDSIDATRGVLQLAAAAGIDAGAAAKITATELNAFGLSGTQATHITDLLASASIAAQGEITDFATAFQQVSAVAHQVNLPLEQTTALLTELARAGISSADAGTSLRTFLLRLVPTTKQAAEFQHALGIEIDKTRSIGEQAPEVIEQYRVALSRLGPVARQEALTQIFGQDAIRAASVIFGQSQGELERLTEELSKSGTGAELAAARMKGLAGATEGLKSSAETLGVTLGGTVLPILTEAVHTLSSITTAASDAAGMLNALGKITVEPIVKQVFAGSDTLAQGGLAIAAGLGLRRLAAWNKERKISAVEAAKEKAATEATAAAQSRLAAVATASAEKQVLAQARVQGSLRETASGLLVVESNYNRTSAAATRAGEKQVAANRLSLASIRTTAIGALGANKGLALGIASLIAGQQLQRGGKGVSDVGSFASAVGGGAIAGSFFGGPGIAIGASLGGIFNAISQTKREVAERHRTVREKVNQMTFEEQQEFFAKFPQTTSAGIAGRPGLKGRRYRPSLEQFLKDNSIVPKANPFDAITAAVIAQVTPPTVFQADQFKPFVFHPPRRPSVDPQFDQWLDDLLHPERLILPKIKRAIVDPGTQIDLLIAQADTTPKLMSALRKRIALDNRAIEAATAELNKRKSPLGPFVHTAAERKAMMQRIIQLIAQEKQDEQQLDAAIADLLTLPFPLTLAAIKAEGTDTLFDNIAAAVDNSAFYRAIVNNVRITGKAHDDAVIALAQSENNEKALRDQQESKNKADAQAAQSAREQALNVRQAELQRAADLAGNVGAPERALHKFLVDRRNATAAHTAERVAAQSALDAQEKNAADQETADQESQLRRLADRAGNIGKFELKLLRFYKEQFDKAKRSHIGIEAARTAWENEQANFANATASLAKQAVDVRNAQIQTSIQAAQATPGIADDKLALNVLLRFQNKQLDKAVAAVTAAAKKGKKAQNEAKLEVESWKQAIIQTEAALKDLTGGGSAFTLNDLFKAAADQFNQFGSNISQAPTTAGGARTALAGNILAQKPDNLAAVVSSKADTQIQEAKTSNEYLKIIADHMVNLGLGTPDKQKKRGGGGVSAAVAAAKFANAGIGSD